MAQVLRGVLQVNVIEGNHLQDENDSFQTEIQDPYCVIQIGEEQHRTKVKNDCMHPQWNEQLDFMEYVADNSQGAQYGKCIVKDKDIISDDFIGMQQFELPTVYNNKWETKVLELKDANGSLHGVVTLQTKFVSANDYGSQLDENTEEKAKEADEYDKNMERALNRNKCCDCIVL